MEVKLGARKQQRHNKQTPTQTEQKPIPKTHPHKQTHETQKSSIFNIAKMWQDLRSPRMFSKCDSRMHIYEKKRKLLFAKHNHSETH